MKKLINDPQNVVDEMCRGLVFAHPVLTYDPHYKILRKKTIRKDKVTLISGGGSGHEPAHAGFIGTGMLDAAVCGEVFASPSQVQVYHGLLETKSDKGTLMIIKNYSGDVMNFRNAAALAEGDIHVDSVIVNDDVAVKDSLYTVGSRGVAGTVLVHKIAGAAAECGYDLQRVKEAAQEAIDHIRSIGFAFTSCTVPAKGTPTFTLDEDEMEYGVGIHGEPGIGRQKIKSADELAVQTVNAVSDSLKLRDNDEVTVLINGFGATPLQELYLFNNSVCEVLKRKNIKIYRTFVGNYVTSIDMAGASVSVMKMTPTLKKLLDAPCDAPSFTVDGNPPETITFIPDAGNLNKGKNVYEAVKNEKSSLVKDNILTYDNMVFLLETMSGYIIKNEHRFCELDSYAGDGDFGSSIASGFRHLSISWNSILSQTENDIGKLLCESSKVIMEKCGGASGPIWGAAFLEAGRSCRGLHTLNQADMSRLLNAAVLGVQDVGKRTFGRGAVVGDKTLIDALVPCAETWSQDIGSLEKCFCESSKAAVSGAKATEKIAARMGRAGVVGIRSIGYPDAGAFALGEIFTHLYHSLNFI